MQMKALFIGQSYIDVTFLTDHMPSGDEKTVARDYAVSFGGNAVTAAFCCAKLGIAPDLLASVADDWLGRMFIDMAAKYGISVHHRKVAKSSLSFIMPKGGQRAIVRCRDDNFKHPFPLLDLAGCRALHVDGHQPDAAIHYAKICREAGILTSLDGGGLRANTHDLLAFIRRRDRRRAAVRADEAHARRDAGLSQRARRAAIGGVTHRARKVCSGTTKRDAERFLPALDVPDRLVIDTNGAGDIFHGAYVYSYLIDPDAEWEQHFSSRARRRRIRSSISATRRACRRSRRSTRPQRGSASGGRRRSSSVSSPSAASARPSPRPCAAEAWGRAQGFAI